MEGFHGQVPGPLQVSLVKGGCSGYLVRWRREVSAR